MLPLRESSTVDEIKQCDLLVITNEVRRFLGDVGARTVISVFLPRAFVSIWASGTICEKSVNVVWLADTMFVSEIAQLVRACNSVSAQVVFVSNFDTTLSPIALMCKPGCILEDRVHRRGSKLWMEKFAPFSGSVTSRYLTPIALPVLPVKEIYERRVGYAVMGDSPPGDVDDADILSFFDI
jgi:hypothetical protein